MDKVMKILAELKNITWIISKVWWYNWIKKFNTKTSDMNMD